MLVEATMRFCLVILAAMLLWTGLASAQTDQERQRLVTAVNNLHAEITTCIVYNMIGRVCLSNNKALYDQISARINVLEEAAVTLGQKIGMTEDAMGARLRMETTRQRKLTQDNCVNIASLMERHADRCDHLSNDPVSILEEYLRR